MAHQPAISFSISFFLYSTAPVGAHLTLDEMNNFVYNIPLMVLMCGVVAMMVAILMFDQLRGTTLKDWLSRFWPLDRRRVLHLAKQNGFYFFIDRLIGWSDVIVRLSWIVALPALAGGIRSVLIAAFLISFCFVIRFGCLTYLAAKRVKLFTMPLDYDGFGVYARSANDWRKFKCKMRSPLILSVVATGGFLYAAVSL